MKRTIRVLLLFLCLCLFGSCSGERGTDNTETTQQDLPETLYIVENGKSDYILVIPQGADMELQTIVSSFKNTVRDRTGVSLRLLTDATSRKADEKEILIGKTNREASVQHIADLKCNDYSIARAGNTLVIAGGSSHAIEIALDQLIASCLSNTSMSVDTKDLVDYRASYPISSLKLNGAGIETYRIIYPDGEVYLKQAAEDLAGDIAEKTGVLLSVVSDTTAKKEGVREILIGNTSHASVSLPLTDSAAYRWNGTDSLQIIGNTVYHTMLGAESFFADIPQSGDVAFSFPAETVRAISDKEPYKVMSFNILYKDADNRVSVVKSMIFDELPDSFGLQECTQRWLTLLLPALEEKYACFSGEISTSGQFYLPVFYRKDRLELVEGKTLWLSDTPTQHSKLYDSDQYRTVTYAVLRDKETGEIYTHYNTHLDIVRSAAEGQLKILQKITAESKYPYVVTGDFNIDMSWNLYNNMKKTWRDAREVAEKTTDALTEIKSRIDYCMINEKIVAERFAVVNNPYVLLQQWEAGQTNDQEYYLSDHYPVFVTFHIYDPKS